jgi:Domain of unknown function (DUF4340)
MRPDDKIGLAYRLNNTMKKYIPYLLIILLLGAATAWFVWHKTSGIGSLDEKSLAIDDVKDITKVVLTCSDKRQIELTKPGNAWMVNGKFAARTELTQNILTILNKIRILCPVAYAAHDNVIKQMMNYNVKVEVYTGKSQSPAKTYYIGGPTPDQQGTYILYEENGKIAERPYIAYIPGYRGYLTPNFNTDLETWRSKLLFDYNTDDIKAISIEYPGQEQNSFSITRVTGDSFDLKPLDSKFLKPEAYQQKYIRQFVSFFSPVSVESYDNNYSKKDSMMQTVPLCIIQVTDKNNAVNKVRLFHMPLSQRSKTQFDEKAELMTYDVDRFHAAINDDKDFAIVQYYTFGKLMRNYPDFFFKKPVKN